MKIFDPLVESIASHHLNSLFLLGVALFGGTIGGRLFQKLKIPQVVGYIAIGIILGESGLKIVDHDTIQALRPLSYFALGLIGFMIGGELKKDVILRHGKQFLAILLSEGIVTFFMVGFVTSIIGKFLLGSWEMGLSIGLILGAISSATAPAATTGVLWEYKTKGPLTRTILGIVAMDDGLALILFAIASAIAGSLLGMKGEESLLSTFMHPVIEMGGAVILGGVSAYILNLLLRRYSEKDRVLAFSIGIVLIVLGFAQVMGFDMILAAMVLGAATVNLVPHRSAELFELVESFAPPIHVLFFVLVGTKINFQSMSTTVLVIGATYLVARSLGKMLGAWFGGKISKAPRTVTRYLPLCLFAQAGVAIGLSILAGQKFPGDLGNMIVIVITAATFVVEIVGPWFVKLGVTKAGEIGLNLTEDDLIRMSRAEDVMDSEITRIKESASLEKILLIFSEEDNLNYPVVDNEGRLKGILTIHSVKDTFMAQELSEFLIAADLLEPVREKVEKDMPLHEARRKMTTAHLSYLPVMDGDRFLGMIEDRLIEKHITQKLLEYERKIVSLEDS